jgi:hypothetical protein
MAEEVKKIILAIRTSCTLVPVLCHTSFAIEFGALGDSLDDRIHLAVRIAARIGKHQLVGAGIILVLQFPHPFHQARRQGHGALLPVFWRKSPQRFRGDADNVVAEVHVSPFHKSRLLIAKARAEQEFD